MKTAINFLSNGFEKYDLMSIEELKVEYDLLFNIADIGRDIESLKAFNYVAKLIEEKLK